MAGDVVEQVRRSTPSLGLGDEDAVHGVVGTSEPAHTYRADIDGLRAVAVLAVVLYHLGAPLPGGFVGVDIFFVISGFLITGIIVGGIRDQRFSLADFYARRARRILPALLAMVAVVTVAGALLLTPQGFFNYGRSLVATSLSASNVFFATQSSYFDQTASLRPLLHTWSLGVEEQFYAVFPLLLVLGARFRTPLWTLIAGVTALSLVLSIGLVGIEPTFTFYLPFTRVWELTAGGLLAVGVVPVIRSKIANQVVAVVGAALLSFAIVRFDEHMTFPGAAALVPVLGAALLIHAGSSGTSLAGRCLSTRPMVFVGLISYSLYLWHWPLVVFAGIVLGHPPALLDGLVLFVVAMVLAVLSWRFVERPFRRRAPARSRQRSLGFAAVGLVLTAAVGLLAMLSAHVPIRLPDEARSYAVGAEDTNPLRETCDARTAAQVRALDVCVIGARDVPPSAAVVGDSFGDAMLPGVAEAAEESGVAVYVLTYAGCRPLLGLEQKSECEAYADAVREVISGSAHIRDVLVVARWSTMVEGERFGVGLGGGKRVFMADDATTETSYEENQRVFERRMAATVAGFGPGKHVSVAAYIPEQTIPVPATLTARSRLGLPLPDGVDRSTFEERQRRVREVLEPLSNDLGFAVIDIGGALCNERTCPVAADGATLYFDDNHFSTHGARHLSDAILPAFQPVRRD